MFAYQDDSYNIPRQFRLEEIHYSGANSKGGPVAEVLCVAAAGQNLDQYFNAQARSPEGITNDLALVSAALSKHLGTDSRYSFNILAATAFDRRFEDVLKSFASKVGGHTFELIEHGGVPHNADPAWLEFLHGKYNVLFALDDISPLEKESQERLDVLGENVQMIKFHYSVMDSVRRMCGDAANRQGTPSPVEEVDMAFHIRKVFQKAITVFEGVLSAECSAKKANSNSPLDVLKYLGADAVQIYTPSPTPLARIA